MITTLRALRLRAGLIGAALVLAATQSFAAYPDKPIRLVVPFAPGGGTDLIARTLGAGMSTELGQQVIVDNKPGAGTIIGTDAVAKSAPDGYNLVIATFAHAVNPSLQPKLPYAHDKAFAPVIADRQGPERAGRARRQPVQDASRTSSTRRARKPGKLTYASQGNGTSAHLAGEMFTNLAKVEMTHVPYRGAGPAITDLLGGQVDMIFGTAAAVSTFVDSGKLRAIAVTTPQRVAVAQGRAGDRRDRARLRGRKLVRPLCARRHAGRRHRQAQRRREEGGAQPRVRARRSSRKAWSSRASDPAELDRYVRGRGSALAKDRQGKQHQARVTDSTHRTGDMP